MRNDGEPPLPPIPRPIIVDDDYSLDMLMHQSTGILMSPMATQVVPQEDELPFVSYGAELLIASELIVLGEKTSNGQIIEAVTAPWLAIFHELQRDPEFLLRFEPRQMEELIAGSYRALGYRVELTSRSGDGGRDVIAIHDGIKVRLLDQVKRNALRRLVTAEQVRALYGVLNLDQAANKAVITTTSDFAPGVAKEFERVIPYRLELRNGAALRELIGELAKKS